MLDIELLAKKMKEEDSSFSEEEFIRERNKDHKVLDKMVMLGDNFERKLADVFHNANWGNFKKLRLAFPEYWEKYGEKEKLKKGETVFKESKIN